MQSDLHEPVETQEERVSLGEFRRAREAHEYGLVVLSQGLPYWVERGPEGFSLMVPAGHESRLRSQLDLYRTESAYWPPVAPEMPDEVKTIEASLVWVILLVTAYGFSLREPQWIEWGKNSSHAVMNGDYYRVFSALFFHADIGHLVSNAGFGAFFLFWVSRQLGALQALAGAFLAGAAGNFLNVLIYYPEPHYSIGASTSVFGIVAMLVAFPFGVGLKAGWWRSVRLWAPPLVMGLILLGWFGAGGENTDVSAHLTGFLCGLPLGFLGGWRAGRSLRFIELDLQKGPEDR